MERSKPRLHYKRRYKTRIHIIDETISCKDREMDENAKKIIKNISKTTQIDKNKKLTSDK